jgi:hypothetical protein
MAKLLKTSTGRISNIENGSFLPSLSYIRSCKSLFHLSAQETIKLFTDAYEGASQISLQKDIFKDYYDPQKIANELFEIIGIVALIDSAHHSSVLSEISRSRQELEKILDSPPYLTPEDIMGLKTP